MLSAQTGSMQACSLPSGGILYLEPCAGVSGDMFVGALLDLGIELAAIETGLAGLDLGEFRLQAVSCQRSGIRATKFDVIAPGAGGHSHSEVQDRHLHRSFRDIRKMIRNSGLSSWAKDKATDAFQRLAEAEGKIHSQAAEDVHFHEVGALDSIVDIIGTTIAIEYLKPQLIVCAPINVGQGWLTCSHGRYPAPSPAAVELLKGVPIYSDSTDGELTTPTGAALLAVLVDRFDSRPLMRIRSSGYGAGARDIPGAANVFRITIGEPARHPSGDAEPEAVAIIEADIDDMTPQLGGHFVERALAEGALDVCLLPVQMKKNRQGVRLSVACAPADVDRLAGLVFSETTTIGVRYFLAARKTLERRHEVVRTEYGEVRIKVAELGGRRVNYAPEYEDCRKLAGEKGVALKDVLAAAIASFLKR